MSQWHFDMLMKWLHMQTVTVVHATVPRQSGEMDGGTRYSTPSVWRKDDWVPYLTDNHLLDLTFTKGLLPDSKQDNIIQHKIPSCQDTPRATLIKHSKVNLFFFLLSFGLYTMLPPKWFEGLSIDVSSPPAGYDSGATFQPASALPPDHDYTVGGVTGGGC